MSYQFEDESALEELLNQQLERRKAPHLARQPAAPAPQQQQQQQQQQLSAARRPSSSAANNSTRTIGQQQQYRPSTAQAQQKQAPSAGDAAATGGSRTKLASWLDGARRGEEPTVSVAAPDSRVFRNTERPSGAGVAAAADDDDAGELRPPDSADQLRDRLFNEAKLQEMSKQRLIQLILEEVRPVVIGLSERREAPAASDIREIRRLEGELELERRRVGALERAHDEQLRLEQSKWELANKQLAARLEAGERELQRLVASQQEHLERLHEQHSSALVKLSESYEVRMRGEREAFAETLNRHDEMHQFELKSKLSADATLKRLDTLQSECARTVEATLKQLESHFQTIESLLDRQAIQVNGTNCELAAKTKHLAAQYERFERQADKLAELADELRVFVPKYSSLHEQNETILGKIGQSLAEFQLRNESLVQRELELNLVNSELQLQREKLQEEQNRAMVEQMKLQFKEERLGELARANTELELKLGQQRRDQEERELKLQAQQTSLESKVAELREQNYDLHLVRKRLIRQQEELASGQLELTNQRQAIQRQADQLAERTRKLSRVRHQINCESNQLQRLQKSLVCSLCLERLFPEPTHGTQQASLSGDVLDKSVAGRDKSIGRLVAVSRRGGRKPAENNGRVQDEGHAAVATGADGHHFRRSSLDSDDGGGDGDDDDDESGAELGRLSRRLERDRRQLASECRYVELLATGPS